MKKPSFLFLLILTLSLLATGLIVWKLFLSPSEPVSQARPSPTPPVSKITLPPVQEGRGDSQTDLLKSLKERFPLVEFLPYETEGFSIDYLSPLHLKVKIKEASQSAQIKTEVTDWMLSKGVDPATHQIDWFIPGP